MPCVDMEQAKASAGSLTVIGGGMKRKNTCPFGENYYGKISKLLLSTEPDALDQLKECVKTIQAAQQQPTDEFWDSGDEISNDSSLKALQQKKTQPEKIRFMKPDGVEKKKLSGSVSTSALPSKSSKESISKKKEMEDSESDKVVVNFCSVCDSSSSSSNNPIVVCETCQTPYHNKCHQPELDLKQTGDPTFIFICATCISKSPKSRSASPKPTLVTRGEEKKPSALASTGKSSGEGSGSILEQYKKKKERQQMLRGSLKK